MNHYAIILAAGKGTRMKSKPNDLCKAAMPILGVPMVQWVMQAVKPLGVDSFVTVVGFAGESVKKIVENESDVVWQSEQKGTAHAVNAASAILEGKEGVTFLLPADRPLLSTKTLMAMRNAHEANHNVLTLLTAVVDDPRGYGRIIRDGNGLVDVKSDGECSLEEKAKKEVSIGVYLVDNIELFAAMKELPSGARGEYHLSDLVRYFLHNGKKVSTFAISDSEEAMGVNDRVQLSEASAILQERICKKWMLNGVTIEDPRTTYISPSVEIGVDTIIRPNTFLRGKTVVGENNVIGPDTYLEDVEIGDDNIIEYCHFTETKVGNRTTLGPYLRTRKGVEIGDEAHIGNFNELKNVTFGKGSKCAHLSYLGDASIGEGVNIGCGSIIANYDGVNKFHSEIGDHAFIGSGTILISPVKIEENGFTAAGSTIHMDVPAHAMAIARTRQINKEGYADVFHEKAVEKKKAKK